MKLLNLVYAVCALRAACRVISHIKGNHARMVKASHKAVHMNAHMFVYAEYYGYHILGHKDISITSYLTRHAYHFGKDELIKFNMDWLWQQINLTKPCYNSSRYTTAVYIDGDPEGVRCEKQFYNAVRRRWPYQSADAMVRHYPELKTEINQIMYWFNRFDPVSKSLRMCDLDRL